MDLLVDKKMPIKIMFKRTWPYVKDEKKSFVSAFLLIILNVIAGVALPRLTGLYTDYIASSSPILSIIVIIACSTFILSCLSQAFLYIESMILTRAGQRIVYKLRMEVFSHIESMSQNQFNDMAVGSLVTRVCSYTSQLSEFFTNTLVHIIRESLTVIVTFVWMIVLSPVLGGILAAVIVLIFIISIIFSTEIHKVFHKERKQISDINTYLNESLSGMKIVQIFNQERRFTKKFQDKNHEYFKIRYKITWLFSIYRPLVSLIYILTIALIIYSGSRIGLTAGTIVSFYLFLDYLFEPIQKLADEINHISRATTAMERLYNLLDIKPEVLNKDNSVVLDHIKGKIEFRHVYFAYEKENWILKDVSFVINPRETVAFVGVTGAGKTTILGLIVRNFEIQRGQILIDDIDIRDIDINCLRTSIGQMLQDVFLFTGSIKDNITLFDNGYTDQEVNEAIEIERQNAARIVSVERPVQNGDTVTIDFEGFMNGVAFEGLNYIGSQKNQKLKDDKTFKYKVEHSGVKGQFIVTVTSEKPTTFPELIQCPLKVFIEGEELKNFHPLMIVTPGPIYTAEILPKYFKDEKNKVMLDGDADKYEYPFEIKAYDKYGNLVQADQKVIGIKVTIDGKETELSFIPQNDGTEKYVAFTPIAGTYTVSSNLNPLSGKNYLPYNAIFDVKPGSKIDTTKTIVREISDNIEAGDKGQLLIYSYDENGNLITDKQVINGYNVTFVDVNKKTYKTKIDEIREGDLPNPVQQTIYESVSKKLSSLIDSKSKIIEEVNAKFKDAEEKYK